MAAAAYSFARSGESDLTTVPSVDLNRYLGKWYEISRYPNRFQKRCVGDTTATYTLREDGKITVLNSCRKGMATWMTHREARRSPIRTRKQN